MKAALARKLEVIPGVHVRELGDGLTIEPVSTGVAIRTPYSNSESPSSSLRESPMMEKIVHTAKHTVNAMVDIDSARVAAASGAVAETLAWSLILLLRNR